MLACLLLPFLFLQTPQTIVLFLPIMRIYIGTMNFTNSLAIAKYDHHTIHTIINSSPILHVSCEFEFERESVFLFGWDCCCDSFFWGGLFLGLEFLLVLIPRGGYSSFPPISFLSLSYQIPTLFKLLSYSTLH